MLTHVQASHTDALKTHSLQTFLPQDWKTKRGQRPRKKIDIRVVPALREDSPDRKVPFQYCSNLIVFDRQGGILESYRLDTDLIALCYAPDEQRWYSNRLPAGDHPDVSVFIPIDK